MPGHTKKGAIDATPAARRWAEGRDVDLMDVEGSGKGGRITKGDVQRHIKRHHADEGAAAFKAEQEAFLVAYKTMGCIVRACEAAKVGRQTVYDWRTRDAAFAQAMENAKTHAKDLLVAEARRRAVEGTRRVKLYQGKPVKVGGQVLYEHEYSDTLLIFLIKQADPSFREHASLDLRHGDLPEGDVSLGRQRLAEIAERVKRQSQEGNDGTGTGAGVGEP